MRFHRPEQFEQRIRKAFAWLPVRIDRDTVWLESYRVTEKFVDGKWEETDRRCKQVN